MEELIRKLAAAGELTHLSLFPLGKEWCAVYTPAKRNGQARAVARDPVTALTTVLTAKRMEKPKTKAAPAPDIDPLA